MQLLTIYQQIITFSTSKYPVAATLIKVYNPLFHWYGYPEDSLYSLFTGQASQDRDYLCVHNGYHLKKKQMTGTIYDYVFIICFD